MIIKVTMNPEVKALWCSALRSDEYLQGTGQLRVDNKFCCLGVLTDLGIKAGVLCETYWDNSHHPISLPDEIMKWAGLLLNSPTIEDKSTATGTQHLSNLNDMSTSFKEIANLIEEKL